MFGPHFPHNPYPHGPHGPPLYPHCHGPHGVPFSNSFPEGYHNQGYEQGYNSQVNQGYEQGYSQGSGEYEQGYNQGVGGYGQGFEQGYNQGNQGYGQNNQCYQQQGYNQGHSTCYIVNAQIIQRPEVGRETYVIQLNAQHHGKSKNNEQYLTMTFNKPVIFVSCSNGNVINGNNTPILNVALHYFNNENDNIGMGDFIVRAQGNDLSIMNCSMSDGVCG